MKRYYPTVILDFPGDSKLSLISNEKINRYKSRIGKMTLFFFCILILQGKQCVCWKLLPVEQLVPGLLLYRIL